MADVVRIPLHPTRGMVARMSLQHVVAGFILLITGLEGVLGHEAHDSWHRVLAWLALLSGGPLLVATAWEIRHHRPGHHPAIGWVEVFAGIVLCVEGLEAWKPHKFVQPGIGYFLAGAWTIALGLRLAPVRTGRWLELSVTGMRARLRPFRRFEVRWNDVAAVREVPAGLEFTLRPKGVREFALGSVANRNEVVRAVLGYPRPVPPVRPPAPEPGTPEPLPPPIPEIPT